MSHNRPSSFRPAHGGDLVSASQHYGIAIDQWLDLSTGINPEPYPVNVPSSAFTQLPYTLPDFIAASTAYYGSPHWIASAGTQVVIQQLPSVLPKLPVLLPAIAYTEHKKHWQAAAVNCSSYPSIEPDSMISAIDQALAANPKQHLVVVNPNNPTGVLLKPQRLLDWASQLRDGGCLIVDEAFIDLHPDYSLLSNDLADNIVVLRSFGKFFGLAGIRLGYCFSNARRLKQLQEHLGLWPLNGPAQAIAISALQDKAWQQQTRLSIHTQYQRLRDILTPIMEPQAELLPEFAKTSNLFLSYRLRSTSAYALFESLASQGILVRVIDIDQEDALLRIGLYSQENKALEQKLVSLLNRDV